MNHEQNEATIVDCCRYITSKLGPNAGFLLTVVFKDVKASELRAGGTIPAPKLAEAIRLSLESFERELKRNPNPQ
jgi:hypothetical protein